MFRLMLRKIWNKKWMVICLLIGNILLVAVAAGTPMYTQAVLDRLLTRELSDYMDSNNSYPVVIQAEKGAGSVNVARGIIQKIKQTQDLFESIPDRLGIAVESEHYGNYITSYNATPLVQRGDDTKRKEVRLGCFRNFEEHISLVAGNMYSGTAEDGTIEVLVSRKTLSDENLILGEELWLNDVKDLKGNSLKVRVTGVFDSKSTDDPYWVHSPGDYEKRYIMPEKAFQELFVDFENPKYAVNFEWSLLLDYTDIRPQNVETLIERSKELGEELKALTDQESNFYFTEILEKYLIKEKRLKATLEILQVPVYILLGIYIYMVSRQMTDLERNETAVLKSRGASRYQIIKLYFFQSIFIAGCSMVIGVPLGFFFCGIIGNTNSFLEFVGRSALKLHMNREAFLYSSIGTLFSVLVMTGQAFKNTSFSIVVQKRGKNRKAGSSIWTKAFFDVIILGVSLYGLYTYRRQENLLAERVLNGGTMEPLLFLSSILFIIGGTLAALRFFPLLLKVFFCLAKKRCSAAAYTTFRQIIVTQHTQGFMLLFLVLTISMGIFNANVARTINSNEEDKIKYVMGADLVVQEKWDSVAAYASLAAGPEASTLVTAASEPDFDVYRELNGVSSAAKVFIDNSVRVMYDENTFLDGITLMGINTREFGETVEFEQGLLPMHWYNYLNAMSEKQEGILVSKNFADVYGYKVGDSLEYQDERYGAINGIICGFVEYWPSYVSSDRVKEADGSIKEVPHFLIVAHLPVIQYAWGVLPYQVWMKVSGSTDFFYKFASENGKKYTYFADEASRLADKNKDPLFQGTNGILTLGFLIVLMLCAAGFLIYWITSIRSRTLQFGIYAAMGMSVREVFGMLVMEQVFLSGIPVAFGFFIGSLVSKLYIPLIGISYGAEELVIPLKIIRETGDLMRVLILAAAMITVCMIILGILVSRLKVVQALKLGED